MGVTTINKAFINGRWLIPVTIAVAFLARIFAGIGFDEIIPWSVLLIQIGIALLLLQINYNYTLIQARTTLPAFLYLLFVTPNTESYSDLQSNLLALVYTVCIIFTLSSYQSERSQTASFNIALLFTAISIVAIPSVIVFIPFFWVAFYYLRSLNIKSFIASLLGILTAFFFLLAWSIYQDNIQIFLDKVYVYENIFDFQLPQYSMYEWIRVGFLLFLLFISSAHIFMRGRYEKIRTSKFFAFMFLQVLAILGFLFILRNSDHYLTMFFFIPLSLMSAYYFTLSGKKLTAILFIVTILFFIGDFFL